MNCPFLNVSQPEYGIPDHQEINLIAAQNCPFLILSQPEYAIPEHQKVNPLAGLHWPFENVPHPVKAILEHQQIDPLCGMATRVSERFAAWKRDSWASANQPHYWTEMPIFQRFASWKHDSWASANQPSCRIHCSYQRLAACKRHLCQSGNRPPWKSAYTISERCAPWKLNSLPWANRKP